MSGLYVHYPFCRAKCAYCDFFSGPYRRETAAGFERALLLEAAGTASPFPVRTVYFGGGTPSLMNPDTAARIIDHAGHRWQLAADAEITLEANPGTLSLQKLKSFRQAGINRISLGVQALDTEGLALLGRIHSADQVFEAVEMIASAGFDNFGFDLIYGIPGQTEAVWSETLERLIRCKPNHFSCYALELEPEVPLARRIGAGLIPEPDDDEAARLYYNTIEQLTCSDYQHYEISNFARPGFACRHNINYWAGGDYLGIGPGAVSCINDTRYKNKPDVENYVRQSEAGQMPSREILETMNPWERAVDAMMLGLRMMKGVSRGEYSGRFGFDPAERFREALAESSREGLIQVDAETIRLTPEGYFLSNVVFLRILETEKPEY